jgi:DNA-binding transcriptional regulator YiaG
LTKEEFAAIRAAAGMTYSELADYLWLKELRSVQRYESGERSISGPVEKLMRILEKEVARKLGEMA